jgi:hypothetical protein
VAALAGKTCSPPFPAASLSHLVESAANSPDVGYSTGEAVYERHPEIKEEVEKCRADLLSASTSSTKDFRAQLRSSANILSEPPPPHLPRVALTSPFRDRHHHSSPLHPALCWEGLSRRALSLD